MFLGFSSGLPLALTGATLSVWLVEGGIAKTAIGMFALVGLPYTLKFAWAPLIDRLRLPVLTPAAGPQARMGGADSGGVDAGAARARLDRSGE